MDFLLNSVKELLKFGFCYSFVEHLHTSQSFLQKAGSNILSSCKNNKSVYKLLVWVRGFLAENNVPETVFDRFKSYSLILSENMLDIEVINECLKNDISYLNSKEELLYLKYLKKKKRRKITKYYDIKIVSCHDIIELNAVRDRVFVIEINMDTQDTIYNYFKKNSISIGEPFNYKLKLSSLNSSL